MMDLDGDELTVTEKGLLMYMSVMEDELAAWDREIRERRERPPTKLNLAVLEHLERTRAERVDNQAAAENLLRRLKGG